ncbi:hypothetical protein FC905_00545 [Clostridium botulinum]|nr:hypothetical protein VT91_27910 [Clostridium sporogenes]MBZ1342703.1 hypothetical protein [Clostridium botulinum]KRU30845.1 hypothetical protein WG71_06280 [Clostridium sporogenes]KRU31072.1 hypothetical protein VT28_13620 [Clostridium sporogenes]KRU37801.1 hypothetical protein VT95_33030 [Clostridium sporogenes]
MINRISDDAIEIWNYNPINNFNNIIEICYKINDEDFLIISIIGLGIYSKVIITNVIKIDLIKQDLP